MAQDRQREEYDRRIGIAARDADLLSAISHELMGVAESWAGPLRFKIAMLTRQARKEARGPRPTLPPSSLDLKRQALGLPKPDGRPLYEYRLSNDAFVQLQARLGEVTPALTSGGRGEEGFFVLWAAEWFRRCYRGGLRKWQDVGDVIGLRLSQSEWRALADRGLRQWGLSSVRLNGVNHRLLALARQGGFPVAAVESGNWATSYLEKVVGGLLGQPDTSTENAMELAKSLCGHVPETWQYDDFFALSADLALAVVRLRRQAENHAAAAGLPASVWLESNFPDWRDALPIVIDSTAGARLIDGLMRATALRGVGGSVRAIRLLRKGGEGWQPALRLQLSGTVESSQLNHLQADYGRLRAVAAGQLARHIGGELAILEPPSEETTAWTAQSLRRITPEFEAPLTAAAEIELRAEGNTIARVLLPGGEGITSPMLVLTAEDASDDTEPTTLAVIGSSSGRYRAEPLFLHLPDGWSPTPGGDEENVESVSAGVPGHTLWSVRGGAIVRSTDGDAYRVLAGQEAEARDQLIVSGKSPPVVTPVAADVRLFCGNPMIRLKDRRRERAPNVGELWLRMAAGPKRWTSAPPKLPMGFYELAWKDAQTGHMRDRCRVAVMPENFRIHTRTTGGRSEVSATGWEGFSIPKGANEVAPGCWRVNTGILNDRLVTCRLKWGDGSEVNVTLTPSQQAGIAYWDGHNLPPRNAFALADTKQLVAHADAQCELMALTRDRYKRRVPGAELRWRFDRELAMSAIRDDIASLLSPLGDLDAEVELSFNDGIEDYWYVKQFDIELTHEPRGLIASKAITRPDVRVIGRSMASPSQEHDFGPYTLDDCLNHRPIALPCKLRGVWLIYLRAGDRVLSRPKLHFGGHGSDVAESPLGRVMTIEDKDERQAAIDQFCDGAGADTESGYQILRSIIGLVVGLKGLPPSTFDILSALAARPDLVARLAFFASEEERPLILAVADGLPFCWFLVAKRHWDTATQGLANRLWAAVDGIEGGPEIVATDIRTKRLSLSERDPTLNPLLDMPSAPHDLLGAAQSFMNRSADRVSAFGGNPFRPQLDELLPQWRFDPAFHLVLDAPCAAALAALERFTPDPEQLCRLKAVARSHPRYFTDAFVAYYQENRRG